MSYLPCSQHTQRQNCLSSTLGYCSSTASAIPPQQCCSSPSAVIFGGFLSRGAGAAKSSCHLCSTLMSVVTVFLQMRVQRGQADQPSVRAPHTRHGFHKVPPRISRSELQGVSICPCFYPESSCSARSLRGCSAPTPLVVVLWWEHMAFPGSISSSNKGTKINGTGKGKPNEGSPH